MIKSLITVTVQVNDGLGSRTAIAEIDQDMAMQAIAGYVRVYTGAEPADPLSPPTGMLIAQAQFSAKKIDRVQT